MGINAELVRAAEAARERLVASQHATEQAKADYHHAIRRIHAAGGSLREIAEALRLSHQRVHQIVDDGAEPSGRWWSRRVRRGQEGPCSFCGRSRTEAARLLPGPEVFICDDCVGRAERVADGAEIDGGGAPLRIEPSVTLRCSFCRRRSPKATGLVASDLATAPVDSAGHGPRICQSCREFCHTLLATPAPS